MYIPPFNHEEDHLTLVDFMQAHSFITLVSSVNAELSASHIPVVITHMQPDIIIKGHLARANPQCQAFDAQPLLAIFSGPHAYISPQHYDSVQSVPTWNYVAVHASGVATTKDDPEALEAIIMQLVNQHEAGYAQQWDSLSDAYKKGMMRGIVGFEMRVTTLEGKYKLSQNKSGDIQRRIAQALSKSEQAHDRETGEMMLARLRS